MRTKTNIVSFFRPSQNTELLFLSWHIVTGVISLHRLSCGYWWPV